MLAIHSGKLFRSTNNDEEKFLLFDSHLNKVIKVSEESHIKFLGKTRFFFSTLTCKSLKKKIKAEKKICDTSELCWRGLHGFQGLLRK